MPGVRARRDGAAGRAQPPRHASAALAQRGVELAQGLFLDARDIAARDAQQLRHLPLRHAARAEEPEAEADDGGLALGGHAAQAAAAALRIAPRLRLVSVTLDPGDNSLASFRAALEALTGVYGEPDNNPFDEAATDMYEEYGMLDASWVKEDVRIYLSLQRMYEDYLELSFSPRICFDASDLDA